MPFMTGMCLLLDCCECVLPSFWFAEGRYYVCHTMKTSMCIGEDASITHVLLKQQG